MHINPLGLRKGICLQTVNVTWALYKLMVVTLQCISHNKQFILQLRKIIWKQSVYRNICTIDIKYMPATNYPNCIRLWSQTFYTFYNTPMQKFFYFLWQEYCLPWSKKRGLYLTFTMAGIYTFHLKKHFISPHLYPSFAWCKVQSLKTNLSYQAQESKCVYASLCSWLHKKYSRFHEEGFGKQHWLIFRIRRGIRCDNTTVT